MIKVIGPKDKKKYKNYINVTSSGSDRFKFLSPFFLGPVKLYNNIYSKNMENAWQFSKVYKEHLDLNGNPSEQYFKWAKKGWNDSWAHRYPMGKNRKPEYSYWDGKKLDYLQGRQQIYIPLYSSLVEKTGQFTDLVNRAKQKEDIIIFDYDGYSDYDTLEEVTKNPNRKMGHGFVLALCIISRL